jgi:hypothetical protein
MEEKKKHTSELDAIAPLVDGIGNANPYTVPDDYFNSLTGLSFFMFNYPN